MTIICHTLNYHIVNIFSVKNIFFKLPDTDSTNIAAIINGILKGVMSVPTVTYSQALQFLFELGTEKLKNDYLAILKNFFSKSNTTISLKWR